jgi:hypothetical protein
MFDLVRDTCLHADDLAPIPHYDMAYGNLATHPNNPTR